MTHAKWALLAAAAIALPLTLGYAQTSIPGPRGPVVQDRMLFYEAALASLDRRLTAALEAAKVTEARLAKVEKELLAAKERLAASEKRIAALEAAVKKP
jgi:hypothetical protein